jgi:rubrerythrin
MSKTASQSRTKKNLEIAFAGESMANRKYLYFAKLARQMGDEEVAKLFEETADAETGHAHAHLALLYPADQMTVEKILEAAISGERYEHQVMYPGFEKEAKAESEAAAVGEFQDQAAESREHDARFSAMLEQARRRFAHLTTVEKEHADRYQAARDRRRA